MVISTICTASHLPKAACLANSLRETQPTHRSLVCLVERDRSALHPEVDVFSKVTLVSELGIIDFSSFLFQYSALEACMAVKAKILLWAMESFPEEQYFVYLDSDIMAYSRFEELEYVMKRADIVLTPHHVTGEEPFEGVPENVVRTLMCGIFNSGFVALRRSDNAIQFLRWWNKQLERFCYKDLSIGLYFEQRWLELAPSLFEITILREPGYNVANWNIAQRRLTAVQDSSGCLVQGKPLRFFHFSLLETGRDLYYFKKYLGPDNPLFGMRNDYVRAIQALDKSDLSKRSWSYASFHSGERIDYETRQRYRSDPVHMQNIPDPFNESNSSIAAAQARLHERLRA